MIGPASSVTFSSVPKPFKMFIATSRVLKYNSDWHGGGRGDGTTF